ncbi:arsenate reductase ArsC [Streptomyces sp. TRM 70361]|uniref:arsenate-mycothiol transferase ArsC n=1 Tax=Streptomyces sp. TRM 70361 TaxID=3116553 RepID=UPI002E7BA3A0|nr:arsenate reductase ArsC [Streptomyces sp. TRM 70361]MEE1941981.1 arsenate reductase ArsC [Streptomyces sp. TRM 70361]
MLMPYRGELTGPADGVPRTAPPFPALPDRRLATGAARLAARYTGRFPPKTVRGPVAGSRQRPAATARVRTHPVMPAERFADERPESSARTREVPGSALPRVLFVCGHNAGRSQPTAALPAHRAAGRARVSSAGTRPAAEVDPGIVRALCEVGADVAGAFREPLTDEVGGRRRRDDGLRRRLPGGVRPPLSGLARHRPLRRPVGRASRCP